MKHITRQSLPDEEYLKLVGISICVFNQNFGFIIENILSKEEKNSWYDLVDKTSGNHNIMKSIDSLCTKYNIHNLYDLYEDISNRRNRLCHSLQCTFQNRQIMFTKDKNNNQYIIDEEWLKKIIKDNEHLCDLLYELRSCIKRNMGDN